MPDRGIWLSKLLSSRSWPLMVHFFDVIVVGDLGPLVVGQHQCMKFQVQLVIEVGVFGADGDHCRLGSIGQKLGSLLQALGMNVQALRQ
jgi:hypothetical protein